MICLIGLCMFVDRQDGCECRVYHIASGSDKAYQQEDLTWAPKFQYDLYQER